MSHQLNPDVWRTHGCVSVHDPDARRLWTRRSYGHSTALYQQVSEGQATTIILCVVWRGQINYSSKQHQTKTIQRRSWSNQGILVKPTLGKNQYW